MGDIKYYKYITTIIMISFSFNIALLLTLNVSTTSQYLESLYSIKKLFIIQLFIWAMLGSTIACSLFLSQDKEINEIESVKTHPDPSLLRYPDMIDLFLYLQRIITGGILGVIGALILFAGLIFFDANIGNMSLKHKSFFIVFCFLIGLYQRHFLGYLEKMLRKIIEDKIKQP